MRRSNSIRVPNANSQQVLNPKEKSILEKFGDLVIEDDNMIMQKTKRNEEIRSPYRILKKVSEATGQSFNPKGLSIFDKIYSLRTEPVVHVLRSKTWREFFNEHSPDVQARKSRTLVSASLSTVESFHKGQKSIQRNLDETFERLIQRVEELWKVVRISKADEKFYRKTLCKGPPLAVDQCNDLSGYIIMLQAHKMAILDVLRSIQFREISLAKCYNALTALRRKFSKLNNLEKDTTLYWKEELICILDEVRCNSLDVIKNIQAWRRNLWRPLPFYWKGVNYLKKMKTDMNILESDSIMKLLDLVPLRMEDLLCIVFFNPVKILMRPSTSQSFGDKDLNHSQNLNYSHQESVQPAGIPIGGLTNMINEEYTQSILQEFLTNIDIKELSLAANVVIEEEMLQHALTTEKKSLVKKGVFIPTLRLKPVVDVSQDDLNDKDSVNFGEPVNNDDPALYELSLSPVKNEKMEGKEESSTLDAFQTGFRE